MGCGFDRREHARGYCLYAWDLAIDFFDKDSIFAMYKNNSIHLEMKFSEPLITPTKCIVHAEFQNKLSVDVHRRVAMD